MAQIPRERHTPEQIIRKLREAEVELAKGLTTVDMVRKLGVTEQMYFVQVALKGLRTDPVEGSA
jgi:hypothetical protein